MIKNCYIWTRVSTKHQEENGGSLDDQKCKCQKYAKDNGYTIKGYFGGKHESAKTPGKLIKELVAAIKKDKSVKYIIVNQADRFSRDAGQAINIICDLMTHGVIIVEALTSFDTSTPEGIMMIQVKLSMAQWDNTNRTNKFMSGRKHCMESGV
jgi:DNA invertase Pin-like site-specific DNA recombinase